MNKRQAKSITVIVNASYVILTDTPMVSGSSLTIEECEKIHDAQNEWGYNILKRYGLQDPVNSYDEAKQIVLGLNK